MGDRPELLGEESEADGVGAPGGSGLIGAEEAVSGAAAFGGAGRGASWAGLDGGADQVGLDTSELGGQFPRGESLPRRCVGRR